MDRFSQFLPRRAADRSHTKGENGFDLGGAAGYDSMAALRACSFDLIRVCCRDFELLTARFAVSCLSDRREIQAKCLLGCHIPLSPIAWS
jgi:hypothetical protein